MENEVVDKVIPGFEQIRRNWKPPHGAFVSTILPGEYFVTKSSDGIETVLGSCVSACVRDKKSGIGGMNHFMLPADNRSDQKEKRVTNATRYGNFAMESLINDILKHGGKRENLEFKVVGGGRIMNQMAKIGWYNIGFVFDYIFTEGFEIIAHDIGDVYPRKVIYFPESGVMKVKRLKAVKEQQSTFQDEQNFLNNKAPSFAKAGDVEIFK
ncbi:MAG: chemoreceptor glutamine deamidase CheD [Thiotrichales bacterium]|jgi:chemotaxis protein CheD|nr:chemoreceptor glutamine deamidase CheD [Thiotrichales bacterium]MBT3614065.1 chemoreceptor glutamine deamidase CheD [Thiotrichales bacterium]MBT4260876.1 chemoreceptor glutamine deamidase CheD [Thiotrichales bacterium]MBT5290534.1 chemoreceptor glutamine deamidase CheD [Thiotrichales bacterium]MBT5417821.1 chemoreceptor glutamine deamidase CheD [Thiotrichales bacterium]